MRHIDNLTLEEVNRALDRLSRRVRSLEVAGFGDLPHSAPHNPEVGAAWIDLGAGKLHVFNGDSWDSFSKD